MAILSGLDQIPAVGDVVERIVPPSSPDDNHVDVYFKSGKMVVVGIRFSEIVAAQERYGVAVGDAVLYKGSYGIARRRIGKREVYVEFYHPKVWCADISIDELEKIDGGLLEIVAIASEM